MCGNNNSICNCISNNWWWIVILVLLMCFWGGCGNGCGNERNDCGCGCC